MLIAALLAGMPRGTGGASDALSEAPDIMLGTRDCLDGSVER